MWRPLLAAAAAAAAVATVGDGVPRLREMALEGAPRNSVELRDRQAAVLGLAEAAWAALLDDGLAPEGFGDGYANRFGNSWRPSPAAMWAAIRDARTFRLAGTSPTLENQTRTNENDSRGDSLLLPAMDEHETFAFCMCNPPFFDSDIQTEEARRRNARCASAGRLRVGRRPRRL